MELRPSYPLFGLDEFSPEQYDAAGEQATGAVADGSIKLNNKHKPLGIDTLQSFAPQRPFCLTPLTRFSFVLWSLHVLLIDVSTYPPHNYFIYMGYLTHWGFFLSITYLIASLCCSLAPSSHLQATQDAVPHSWLVKMTWALYSTVAPLEVAISLLYWFLLVPASANSDSPRHAVPWPALYVSCMEHGGVAMLVLLDGRVCGHVPVRIKHVFFLIAVCGFYLVWSIIDAAWNIGNGEWGPEYDDDALYPVLNWNQNRNQAAIVAAIAGLVLTPATFILIWLYSLSSWTTRTETDGTCCRLRLDGSSRSLTTMETEAMNSFNYQATIV